LRTAFFLLLNCYRLAQIGPASRIFTEGDEENEDPSWGPRKSASLPSFPSVGLYWVKEIVKKKVLTPCCVFD